VSEDWAAVAEAISQRMTELGINQTELIGRSQVSKATVGELYHNSAQRRRSARTPENSEGMSVSGGCCSCR
jgi:hypothetical protein